MVNKYPILNDYIQSGILLIPKIFLQASVFGYKGVPNVSFINFSLFSKVFSQQYKLSLHNSKSYIISLIFWFEFSFWTFEQMSRKGIIFYLASETTTFLKLTLRFFVPYFLLTSPSNRSDNSCISDRTYSNIYIILLHNFDELSWSLIWDSTIQKWSDILTI